MQKIDLAVWPRAELFRFFSAVSQPFYSVTFRVDVTNLHAYARAHGVSFYYALGYLVTDAVNAVENFRYTIRSGEVWLLDDRVPSFTDLKPGSQQFHIVTLPKEGDLDSFCRTTRAKSEAQQTFLDQSGELDDLIYFSCTPWFDLTGCTNENILDLARYLDEIGKPVWIRHVLVPERSDYDEYLIRLDEFLHSLHNVQRVEVLPYHTLGVFKWETLGIPYKLEGINPPTKERVENANKLLHTAEYTGYLK